MHTIQGANNKGADQPTPQTINFYNIILNDTKLFFPNRQAHIYLVSKTDRQMGRWLLGSPRKIFSTDAGQLSDTEIFGRTK